MFPHIFTAISSLWIHEKNKKTKHNPILVHTRDKTNKVNFTNIKKSSATLNYQTITPSQRTMPIHILATIIENNREWNYN